MSTVYISAEHFYYYFFAIAHFLLTVFDSPAFTIDPGYVFFGSQVPDPTHISESLVTIFGLKILKFCVN